MERLAAKRGIERPLLDLATTSVSPGRCVPVTLAYIRATDASSSRPMPDAAVIRNICSAAAATGTGNFCERAMSWMMPRSFTKSPPRCAARIAVEHVRHAVLEHPGIAGRRRDHLVDLSDVEALLGGERDRFRGGGDVDAGQQLVDHLERGALAGVVAELVEFCGHRIERRTGFVQGGRTAGCEDRELHPAPHAARRLIRRASR